MTSPSSLEATIESNRKYSDEKMNKLTEDLTAIISSGMDKIKSSKASPYNMDSTKSQNPTTVVPDNKKDTPLEDGNYTKTGGMWAFKHEISSPELNELFINTELKVNTAMDLNKFYNQIKTCINAVTRFQ